MQFPNDQQQTVVNAMRTEWLYGYWYLDRALIVIAKTLITHCLDSDIVQNNIEGIDIERNDFSMWDSPNWPETST